MKEKLKKIATHGIYIILMIGIFLLLDKSIKNVTKQFYDPDEVETQRIELAEFIKDSDITNVEIDIQKSTYMVTRVHDGVTESKDFDSWCFCQGGILSHKDYESPDDRYHIVYNEAKDCFIVYYPSTYENMTNNTSWSSN
ncbi:hypothetical protein [Sharpea azabuensis]|uniref:hypothetical protein n=1 Tax=Sharpea azabuensis TaxID=322505 RepID=UPI002E801F27|nr:hypothetical protein [Sharpea azabuensis]MEE3309319.1 hypothetical protein [Sharpea azabuensis]